MIPSTTNRLLVTEDWKKIYQSYRNADFKSYDFDTLRRTMITYLRENYPEDFNDYIDSSEYIALIDLIAYLGQNISFRVDLNARENFLETAERRDSVLRLARLINYNPKRNMPASGILKITAIQTSDNIFDNAGTNLSGSLLSWNDSANANWFEQFITVLNSAMPSAMSFGKPAAAKVIDGVSTEKYRVNSLNNGVPIYTLSKSINGITVTFEITSADFTDSIQEETPNPRNSFSFLYRNDNRGNASSNTGFFVYFKQGTLSVSDFTIDNPVPNEIIGINASNINETDVWLWQLNPDGSYPDSPWTKVSNLTGNNVMYNSLIESNRKLYTVLTRETDQIDINFADGSFGDLPKGQFKLFYRQSNGVKYSIKSDQMQNISFDIPYVNSNGQSQSLKIYASLQYTVSNATAAESNADIKLKAPQAYYSQNRMVTAEDYNIVPLTVGSDILKVKTINRVSSGVSKYFEMSDVSGKYSDVNIFASDGILYKNRTEYNFEYSTTNKNTISYAVKTQLNKILALKEFRSFYIDNYPRYSVVDISTTWTRSTKLTNQSTGYFNINSLPTPAGEYSSNNLNYARVGSLVKFKAPIRANGPTQQQTYFLPNGKLTFIQDDTTTLIKWAKIISIVGDGCNNGKGALSTGIGPVVLSGDIPQDAVAIEVIPKFLTVIPDDIISTIITLSSSRKNFALSFDRILSVWFIIDDTNVNLTAPFSLTNQASITDTNADSSWMISFVWNGNKYVGRYRVTEYIFESEKETSFFVDPYQKNYDYQNDTIIKDKITVLGINPAPDSGGAYLKYEQNWQVDNSVVEPDGYQEPKKVKVSFYDKDDDGQFDNPDSFNDIVNPESTSTQTTFKTKFVFFKKSSDGLRYSLADSSLFYSCPTENEVPLLVRTDGQLFYFYDPDVNVIKIWNRGSSTYDLQTDYIVKSGRSNLKFHYTHRAASNRRIDPSKTNLMDVYLLTNSYDVDFRNWLESDVIAEPLPPTSHGLGLTYSSLLEPIKSISDELIFHPASYKVLFGNRATPMLQATFKAVKNPNRITSDNDLKTRILTAIDSFFVIDNWDFGQTFYFSELATYVMNIMTPYITNFVLVPKQEHAFGSLYEITCQSNEIFVSSAGINDIEIIDSITTTELKALGDVINSIGGQK